ncbi:hypothetical protein GW17_00049472 [Ensete ventricosum]|nr:hypothetical protein GW17_00049472 [Ensete ventricosum]
MTGHPDGSFCVRYIASVDLVMWQLCSFLRAASFSDVLRSCRRPELSCLGSVESLRRSSQGSALRIGKKSPSDGMESEHLYLRGRGGRTRVTLLLQDLIGHRLPVVEGVVHWSIAAPALTRCLSPAIKGYYSSVGKGTVGQPQNRQRVPRGQIGWETLGQRG